MDPQLLAQLDRRLDAQHRHVCARLEELAAAIRETHAAALSRLEAHEAYHRAEEHRWGLPRLAQRHPLRLAAGAFCAGAVALALLSHPALAGFADWIRGLLRLVAEG